jgi:hypothetical protein
MLVTEFGDALINYREWGELFAAVQRQGEQSAAIRAYEVN